VKNAKKLPQSTEQPVYRSLIKLLIMSAGGNLMPGIYILLPYIFLFTLLIQFTNNETFNQVFLFLLE